MQYKNACYKSYKISVKIVGLLFEECVDLMSRINLKMFNTIKQRKEFYFSK